MFNDYFNHAGFILKSYHKSKKKTWGKALGFFHILVLLILQPHSITNAQPSEQRPSYGHATVMLRLDRILTPMFTLR